jgi:hypothetical protein
MNRYRIFLGQRLTRCARSRVELQPAQRGGVERATTIFVIVMYWKIVAPYIDPARLQGA